MPIYVYKCEKCHNAVEVIQKVNEQVQPACLVCGDAMEKQVTSGAFCLMGYGWTKNGMNVTQKR